MSHDDTCRNCELFKVVETEDITLILGVCTLHLESMQKQNIPLDSITLPVKLMGTAACKWWR